jgi:hypothetical protein
MNLIFVDVEAVGGAPGLIGSAMTEFGAVHFKSRSTFHGRLWDSVPSEENPAIPRITGKAYDAGKIAGLFETWLNGVSEGQRPIFISDNNGYDFMWMAHFLHGELGYNPFGHSSRRIGDIYSGLATFTNADMNNGFLRRTLAGQSGYKKWRVTPHDHNPVNDAMGNVEAFQRMLDEHGVTL